MSYKDIIVFKGSCPKCGVFQEKKQSRCTMMGCITLHYYPDETCNNCTYVLYRGNMK